MIITKEQQESMVEKYVKEKRNQDECIGFIDGMNKMLEFIASQPSPVMSAEQVEELGYYYPLFKFFSDEHGLSLLDSQLQDVIHECKKFIEPTSPSVKADGWVSVNKKLAMNIVNQLFDLADVPVEKRQSINDEADAFVLRLLQQHSPNHTPPNVNNNNKQ